MYEIGFNTNRRSEVDSFADFLNYIFIKNDPTNKLDYLGLLFGIWGIDKELKEKAWNFPAVGAESSISRHLLGGVQYSVGKGMMFFPATCELASFFYKSDYSVLKDPEGNPLHLGWDLSIGVSAVTAIPGAPQSDRSARSWEGNFYTATASHDIWSAGVSYTEPPSWLAIGIGPSVGFIKQIKTSAKYIVTKYRRTVKFETSLIPNVFNFLTAEQSAKLQKALKISGMKNPIELEAKAPCICNMLREKVADIAAPDFSIKRKILLQ